MVPDLPPRAGPLRVAARYKTALAEAKIGGDLYAVQNTPFGIRVLIGDVRGKGLQAVATVSVTIGAFRQEAEHAPTLVDLARRLDEALRRENELHGVATEDFTTALLAEISPDGAWVQMVNRGHPPPYLVRNGTVARLDPMHYDLPLGLGLPGAGTATADTHALPRGACLLMVTDGVTEARDAHGTFYDPCAAPRLTSHPPGDPDLLLETLLQDVANWTGGPNHDDMAVLALARRTE